ncbi:MAG: hypothetical protein LBF16_13640 [Pseudomonadales bacterium]|nr:hypothetical protein [Pseudomonadales bacterium]
MKDSAAVMIVSCALAHDFGAMIFYEGETPMSLEVLLQETPVSLLILASCASIEWWSIQPVISFLHVAISENLHANPPGLSTIGLRS